ncbi:major facilitator superfamily domain-containing protein [Microdochium trichocladiopsis]|uniref:Major facilitator superfamily domain-containing protein n=1 Tax=Microdochium trichocladiopsis TaxID=1682393 RepID=A0A9P8Y405_9PEZI|nr:major facilitator superfamily domain-containing protein [Microdochium trichocladiopsis]KAH7030757.1 major facilitator superfamily domain-containing protein [Microdochium trichocladiopsis]
MSATQNESWRDEEGASTTEATPLLRSTATSRPVSSRSSVPDNGQGGLDKDLDVPNQIVSRGRAVAIILSVYLLIFLQASNASGMTMAQSRIAGDLDAYENAMWMTTIYLVSFSSCAPVMGRLSSIFSPRTMVVASAVLIAIGQAIASQAPTLTVFLVGRMITGVGGSAVMVVPFILVLELVSKRRRGIFMGLINAGFTTGISLGAVVYGALIDHPGWRFLFGIQVPLALIAGAGVFLSIPSTFESGGAKGSKDATVVDKLRRIDYAGALLLTSSIVTFLYGLSGTVQWLPLVISAIILICFLAVEKFVARDPLIPLSLLQNRGALLSCFAQLGLMASRWTILFYAPVTALAVRGFAPAASGSMLIPTNLGFGLGGLIVGWLHVKRAGSFYTPSLVSVLLFGATIFSMGYVSDPRVPMGVYILLLFLNGLFTGAALNYTLAHILHLTPPDAHYMSTSLLSTFRGFAGSFGTAIGGGIFIRTLRESLEHGFRHLPHDSPGGGGNSRAELIKKLIGGPALVFHGPEGLLSPEERQVAVHGYVDALRVLFHAAFVLTIGVLVLQAGTGWKAPLDGEAGEEEVREEVFREVVEHDGERDLEV